MCATIAIRTSLLQLRCDIPSSKRPSSSGPPGLWGWKALEIMDPSFRSDKEFAMIALGALSQWVSFLLLLLLVGCLVGWLVGCLVACLLACWLVALLVCLFVAVVVTSSILYCPSLLLLVLTTRLAQNWLLATAVYSWQDWNFKIATPTY